MRTGGGRLEVQPLTRIEEDVVSILGEERVFGISRGLDTMMDNKTPSTVSAAPQSTRTMPHTFEHSNVVKSPKLGLSPPEDNEISIIDVEMKTVKKQRTSMMMSSYSPDESLTLQRELVEIERERLNVEKERLKIERRRMEIEETRCTRCTNKTYTVDNNNNQSEFELFRTAFMHDL